MIPMRARRLGRRAFAVAACTVVVTGCVSTVPVNYAPSSVMTASGAVGVASFRYLPADNGVVAPNQIKNTALGQIKIERDVKDFFRDAVFAELRFVGVKLDDKTRTLSGDIVEFLVDDLGYSIDWTLKVRYQVAAGDGSAPLFNAEKIVQRKTAKFANPFGALNETIKLNVEELLKDPAFIKSIN